MDNVINFINPYQQRVRYTFVNRPVKITDDYSGVTTFPCIVLCEKESGIPVGYPGYERWLMNLAESEMLAETTLSKRAVNVCSFLNFILWNTKIDRLEEVSVEVIREFMIAYRSMEDGTERKSDTWNRCVGEVFDFLGNYFKFNGESKNFNYNGNELRKTEVIRDRETGRKIVLRSTNKFNVKAPRTLHKKNRVLLHGYLDTLLFEAEKHDPDIVLGIALQAYAGLREGEVVNLTRSSIKQVYAGFGRIGKIEIDLTVNAGFSIRRKGKTPFGSIKKFRVQEVYYDFIDTVLEILQAHEQMLLSRKVPGGAEDPIFINKWNRPLSVTAYQGRLKRLFYDYFLPTLRLSCEEQVSWAENAPYIEMYENDYPGAHMLRHWFTMYLLTKAGLKPGEIMKWRGDTGVNSMIDYIHINADLIDIYRTSVYIFQETMLGGASWQE